MAIGDRHQSAPSKLPLAAAAREANLKRLNSKRLALMAGIAIVYFAAGRVGLLFASFSASSTAVWPASGIAFAALLLFGTNLWPAIFAGALLVNLTISGGVFAAVSIAIGNTLEAWIATYLVMRYAHGLALFDSPRDFFKFIAISILAAAISATIGVTSLLAAGSEQSFVGIWLTWLLGDVGGFLLVAPVIVLMFEHPQLDRDDRRLLETGITLAAISIVGATVFGGAIPELGHYPIGFVCIPILVWSAFRFGQREAAMVTFILVASADWGVKHGFGPWARFGDPVRSLILPQAFIVTMGAMAMAIAALVQERKRAEAEANKSRNLAEAANRSKDQFLAMLAHELRNPIAALSSAVRVLERPDVRPEQSAKLLPIISRQSGHLARMVDDLLDVGRVTSGRIALNRRATNVGDCARECVRALLVREEFAGRNIATQIEDVWIDGDPDRIVQIVTNLLSNALSYTRPEGKIVLNVGAEQVRAIIRVADDGDGIAPELLPLVFDLFVQSERGADRRRGGLGIGLTLVRQLTELHGGTVDARSDGLGRGSTFTVSIPRIEATAGAAMAMNGKAHAKPNGRRILIVEDNEDARSALREALEMDGHEVIEAASGAGGVSSALSNRPDLALVDIGLPEIDGYEVARRIRAGENGRKIHLVALTGYGSSDDRIKSEKAGFNAHLVKPLDFGRLTELIDTLCGSN